MTEKAEAEFVWPEGWAPLMGDQRKHHYYVEGKALCGKWLIFRHMLDQFTLTKPRDPHDILQSSGRDCRSCTTRMRERADKEK